MGFVHIHRSWRPFRLFTPQGQAPSEEISSTQEHHVEQTAPLIGPLMNLYEGESEFHLVVELPGIPAEDVVVDVGEDTVSLSCQRARNEVQDEWFRRQERWYGPWERKVQFPGRVDPQAVKATLQYGLLTISVPRAEPAPMRRVPVRTGQEAR